MNWEKEFDEKFGKVEIATGAHPLYVRNLKNFISKAIESQMSELRMEVEKVLERHAQWNPTDGCDSEEEKGFQKGLMSEAKLIRDEVLLLMNK